MATTDHLPRDNEIEDEDEHVCKICRNGETRENPLYHPCKCSGSIKYVHQPCLQDWLRHRHANTQLELTNPTFCEVCKYPYRFTPIYAPRRNEPWYITLWNALRGHSPSAENNNNENNNENAEINDFNAFDHIEGDRDGFAGEMIRSPIWFSVRCAMIAIFWCILFPLLVGMTWTVYFNFGALHEIVSTPFLLNTTLSDNNSTESSLTLYSAFENALWNDEINFLLIFQLLTQPNVVIAVVDIYFTGWILVLFVLMAHLILFSIIDQINAYDQHTRHLRLAAQRLRHDAPPDNDNPQFVDNEDDNNHDDDVMEAENEMEENGNEEMENENENNIWDLEDLLGLRGNPFMIPINMTLLLIYVALVLGLFALVPHVVGKLARKAIIHFIDFLFSQNVFSNWQGEWKGNTMAMFYGLAKSINMTSLSLTLGFEHFATTLNITTTHMTPSALINEALTKGPLAQWTENISLNATQMAIEFALGTRSFFTLLWPFDSNKLYALVILCGAYAQNMIQEIPPAVIGYILLTALAMISLPHKPIRPLIRVLSLFMVEIGGMPLVVGIVLCRALEGIVSMRPSPHYSSDDILGLLSPSYIRPLAARKPYLFEAMQAQNLTAFAAAIISPLSTLNTTALNSLSAFSSSSLTHNATDTLSEVPTRDWSELAVLINGFDVIFVWLLTWVIGFAFVVLWARIVRIVRDTLRPGVLWFIRFSDDPDWSILRSFLVDPLTSHTRRIIQTGLFHLAAVVTIVVLPALFLHYLSLPTIIPLDSTNTTAFAPFNTEKMNESQLAHLLNSFNDNEIINSSPLSFYVGHVNLNNTTAFNESVDMKINETTLNAMKGEMNKCENNVLANLIPIYLFTFRGLYGPLEFAMVHLMLPLLVDLVQPLFSVRMLVRKWIKYMARWLGCEKFLLPGNNVERPPLLAWRLTIMIVAGWFTLFSTSLALFVAPLVVGRIILQKGRVSPLVHSSPSFTCWSDWHHIIVGIFAIAVVLRALHAAWIAMSDLYRYANTPEPQRAQRGIIGSFWFAALCTLLVGIMVALALPLLVGLLVDLVFLVPHNTLLGVPIQRNYFLDWGVGVIICRVLWRLRTAERPQRAPPIEFNHLDRFLFVLDEVRQHGIAQTAHRVLMYIVFPPTLLVLALLFIPHITALMIVWFIPHFLPGHVILPTTDEGWEVVGTLFQRFAHIGALFIVVIMVVMYTFIKPILRAVTSLWTPHIIAYQLHNAPSD